jgi:hypothetical protein
VAPFEQFGSEPLFRALRLGLLSRGSYPPCERASPVPSLPTTTSNRRPEDNPSGVQSQSAGLYNRCRS